MDDQLLSDLTRLLMLCERENLLNGPRAEVAAIRERYKDQLEAHNARQQASFKQLVS